MRRYEPQEILGRLFQRLYRSLPMYLAEAIPWTHPGGEQAQRVLAGVVADARSYCQRIAERILQLRGRLDLGEFPMEFTDLNLLSLDYLLTELVRWQKADIRTFEQFVAEFAEGSEDRALAEEVLGNARGHLQSLEELLETARRAAAEDRRGFLAMPLVDTHAHLDQSEFDADRAAVLQRAHAAGVETIVAIGVTADSSAAVVRLTSEFPSPSPLIYAAVGIHPNYCAEAAPADWDRVLALVGQPRVVALGETGLDRYRDHAPLPLQQEYFDRHLRLSQERDLPFIVHTRESQAEVLAMLREARERGPLRGVMHSFTGDAAAAAECVELGMYISFAGMVTFKKSDDLRAVAATVPPERILVETDSPYLSPHPLRGKRNEPANVALTAECLANVRGVNLEEFAAQTTANARRLFRLDG